eukprot:gene10091-biopygen3468
MLPPLRSWFYPNVPLSNVPTKGWPFEPPPKLGLPCPDIRCAAARVDLEPKRALQVNGSGYEEGWRLPGTQDVLCGGSG